MEKEIKIKYKLTPIMRARLTYLEEMNSFFGKFVSPVFFWQKNQTLKDKIELVRIVADARSAYWEAVYKEWPELVGKNISTIGNSHIEIK